MKFTRTDIQDVVLIEPFVRGDNRGYFMESFLMDKFIKEVTNTTFVQENESCSSYGVLRGLHYQLPPHAQSKLIRVVKGKIYDVAVDIRKDSPTFGKYIGFELSGENKRQLFIPKGFAHGFVTLENNTIVQYKTDNYYAPESEGAIIWDDTKIAIEWPIEFANIILSDKDRRNVSIDNSILFKCFG